MAKNQPWYKVVTPREDLREGKPLDASEFAVHLDQVREGRAKKDYQEPQRFFERTFLTKNLRELAGEVVRRLSGHETGASAVFNLATQFGGGKTHALTLLYHLASSGDRAKSWTGVPQILSQAGVSSAPEAAVAVFVGTEFDSLKGRGGNDGTPLRKTPWGEIAWQLGSKESFAQVQKHEEEFVEPKGDVIRAFLPKDRPCLILLDEIINYVSTYRHKGYHNKLYNFIHSLSETSRGQKNIVLLVSIPASELEYTAEDVQDEQRFKKMLDRVGKAFIMSAEAETSEIIRRRLFEWDLRAIGQNGKVLIPKDAVATCKEYAEWIISNRAQIPSWFPADLAHSAFEASYPFHPMVLSVFERKWQELPRFQQTRGILRLLALWVAHVYREGFKGALKEPLIGLGSAPLDDPLFRSAVFEQLGESKLEGAVTTDITGKKDSHAIRLDQEAVDTIRKAYLHRKVATTIFFESNGGQSKGEATLPEVRLAVAGPEVELGNVETALEALTESCYYLTTEGNRYRFSLKENLNKRFADRRATVSKDEIERQIREQLEKVFPKIDGVERCFFPEKSGQVDDRPVITLVIMAPEHSIQEDPELRSRIESMTREHGKSARAFKSALLWVVPESSGPLREESRKLLAWEDITAEGLKLDESQERQLETNLKTAKRDLAECVWRTYNHLFLLDPENKIKEVPLGLVTSSAAESMTKLITSRLRQTDEIVREVPPRFLVRNWPGAFTEWSTKAVRDAFFASPKFHRLLDPDSIRGTIARGVAEGLLAYVGKSPGGGYEPFFYKREVSPESIEIAEEVYIIPGEEAEKHIEPPRLASLLISPSEAQLKPGTKQTFSVQGLDQFGRHIEIGEVNWTATGGEIDDRGVFAAGQDEGGFLVKAGLGCATGSAGLRITTDESRPPPPPPLPPEKRSKIIWSGEVPPQKWTNLYMKVLTKLVSAGEVKLGLTIEATPKDGVQKQLVEDTKAALRGLGFPDEVKEE